MIEIIIDDKQKFLNENYPFAYPPKLSETRECIQCGETIIIGNFKVYIDKTGFELICYPNAPKCNGTVIDWK